jgi:hypothetical protein
MIIDARNKYVREGQELNGREQGAEGRGQGAK